MITLSLDLRGLNINCTPKRLNINIIECIPDGMKEAGKLLSMFVNEEQHLTQGNNSTKLSCFKS